MIQIQLTKKEIEYIMEHIKVGKNKELYCKLWRLIFNRKV